MSSSDSTTRRRRPRSGGGLSLLAEGEPMVWLTGGALGMCVLMVIGLLCLIAYVGFGTFWPGAVLQVQTVDGRVYLGEVAERGRGRLLDEQLDDLPPVVRQAAQQRIDDERREFTNQKLRIGNFRITNEHFQWVNEFELVGDRTTKPEWAVVVERTEWGRFYGQPQEFMVRHLRQVDAAETRLVEAVQFFESMPFRLEDEQREQLGLDQHAAAIEQLKQQLAAKRRAAVAEFLEPFADSTAIRVVLDDGQQLALSAVEPEHHVVEVHRVWSGSEAAWTEYERHHATVRERFRQQQALTKHDIGAVNRQLETARLSVRQQELSHGVFVLENALEIRTLDVQLEALEQAGREYDQAAAAVAELLGGDSPLSEIGNRLAAALKDATDRQAAAPRSRRQQLREEVNGAPPTVAAAVGRFLDVSQDATQELSRLQALVDELGAENDRYVLRMATVQVAGQPVANLKVEGAAPRLSQGELPTELTNALQEANLTPVDNLVVEPLGTAGNRWRIADRLGRFVVVVDERDGGELDITPVVSTDLALGEVVRAYPANQLTGGRAWGVYLGRWLEFLTDEPREANSEGGVFPAIWGTVAMTLIMSLAVVPFGVLAALYLREYAKGGLIVSAVRIAINNLAGVPSIVFGVFGVGFFCYGLGTFVDGGPEHAGIVALPPATWWMAVVALTVVAVAAFLAGLASLRGPGGTVTRWKRVVGGIATVLWIVTTGGLIYLIAVTPYYHGWFAPSLPNPTFGKGGLLWAALTLALMTLPVVIVATEEALSAVPNSLREGSYACGASKWQTLRRIVLPHAMPGIMTGMILAMARGAGEVAPLMLVGAVKLAPELPIDAIPPFLHADRSFMHLGFHIYDLGFQSQNSEAARPLVFTTTVLLIGIIFLLNLAAVGLRARLRRRFQGGQF